MLDEQIGEKVRIHSTKVMDSKNNFLDLDCYPYTASSTMLLKDFVKRADKVLVTWSDNYPEVSGQDLNDLAIKFGCNISDTIDKLYPAGAIYFQMGDDDLNRILKFPGSMIGSDGIPGDKHPHPRLWGTFPRVLGKYVRQEGVSIRRSCL